MRPCELCLPAQNVKSRVNLIWKLYVGRSKPAPVLWL
jgi:hypothetical protein